MTLNAKIGGFMDFWRFRAARHILRANCAETNWDRHGQAAREIVSIKGRFRKFKPRFSKFKETCARGHQKAVPPVKVIILPFLASDELYSQCWHDWWLWKTLNFQNRSFFLFIFVIFGCSEHSKNEWPATKWLEIDWQFALRKKLLYAFARLMSINTIFLFFFYFAVAVILLVHVNF